MDEARVPTIRFETNKLVNEFCHISVLYADRLPSELALGMLGNKQYQDEHATLRRDCILQMFQKAGQGSARSWYSLARALMRARTFSEVKLDYDRQPSSVFLNILGQGLTDYDQIWESKWAHLDEYKNKFSTIWAPISRQVLHNLSALTKNTWEANEIRVHFVDCLFGGFAWIDCIAFAAFPDFEVQKKFLTHELSELITPRSTVEQKLAGAGLNPEITHTVVDVIAYFSVKDFITKPVYPHPERRGIRPNPNYYPAVEETYPLFERYAEDPSSYKNFGALVEDLIQRLKCHESEKLIQSA